MPSAKQFSVEEYRFNLCIRELLDDISIAEGKKNKMIISTKIYRQINNRLENILLCDQDCWTKFAATVYNKTTEFNEQVKMNEYDEVDKNVVENFKKEYMKAREFIASFLKDVNNPTILNNDHVAEALKNIKKEEAESSKRPRRNIPVVDYTGMYTIEPYDEYDGITNIWDDDTVWYDSDYNPEDDDAEEDDDEEDDDEEDDEKFKRKMPFVAVREKKQVSIMKLRGREIVRVI